jgi:hypothetical protein
LATFDAPVADSVTIALPVFGFTNADFEPAVCGLPGTHIDSAERVEPSNCNMAYLRDAGTMASIPESEDD